jgi:hypothetical protein
MLKHLQPEEVYYSQPDSKPAGYAHPSYIQSFSEFGTPVCLSSSGSWILSRTIPGTDATDGIGAYPFFVCADFTALMADLDNLRRHLVSVAVVPDPMSSPPLQELMKLFDIAAPFKTHFLADLDIDFSNYLRRHHRRYAARALENVDVQLATQTSDYADEWADLYLILIARHGISGIRAFSPKALAMQLAVPGCYYFRALSDNTTVAALVCYLDRGVAYAHLVSTTENGQELMAQYALYWKAIEYFRDRARWFVLGSTPGTVDVTGGGGLAAFKRGWATNTCSAYFLGRILDQSLYNNFCELFGHDDANTFPAYRGGVFG